jgi:hypothetical protein
VMANVEIPGVGKGLTGYLCLCIRGAGGDQSPGLDQLDAILDAVLDAVLDA